MVDDDNATPKPKKKKTPRPGLRNPDHFKPSGNKGRPKGRKDKKPRKKYVEFTPALQWKFLDTLSKNGNIKAAAGVIDISTANVYKFIREDEHFSDLVDTALAKYLAKCEDELSKRVFEGNETLEYDGEGTLVRRIVKKDNDLLKLALKAADRERYSERPISVDVNVDTNNAIGKLAEFLKLDAPEPIEGEYNQVDEEDGPN